MKLVGLILVLGFSLTPRGADSISDENLRFFQEQVRPIFEQHCFKCHSHQSGKMKGGLTLDSRSGWENGGQSGSAVRPGEPEKSLLITAVRQNDPDLKMPPKEKLSESAIAALEEWVRRGAPDDRKVHGRGTLAGPGNDWWSLKPLVRPALPREADHPVDAFISEKLMEQAINPVPEADRRTLIRRLKFDLHGVLPTPEEVDAFVSDPDEHAYEKLVERILASPRYGERRARQWLDAVHFADTHGAEHDQVRTNAWRYRDYVIESFNRDTLWPRFIREQLAADVFFPDEPRLIPALGFIAAGPLDLSTAATAPNTFDYLDRDDIVTQTMSTFASATVHCARCHDHKFDPITQEDYYALQAVFAGVGKGDVAFDPDRQRHRERRRWNQLLAAADREDADVVLSPEHERLVTLWEESRGQEAQWETVEPDVFLTAGAGSLLRRAEDGSLLATGPRPETDIYTLAVHPKLRRITAVRLEVLADTSLPMGGPGRADNGNFHLTAFEAQVFPADAGQGVKLPISRATASFNQSGWNIEQVLDGKLETGWGVDPSEGKSHVAVFEFKDPLELAQTASLTFQLKQLHGRGHVIGKFRLSVTADPPDQAVVLPVAVVEALKAPRDQRTPAQRLALACFALGRIAEEKLAALPPPALVFAGAANFKPVAHGAFYKPWSEPKPVYILRRGDIDKPGPLAVPGAIAAVTALAGRFSSEPSNEAARRAALADWLADPQNPLTWRSIANRIWQYHFGRGLSDSPNDLGRMGSLPTHPELLEWLACELRDSGGSIKRLSRLILTSAVYRRAAQHSESAAKIDPANRLLWRRLSQRLDAESFRDTVLAVSGRLDLAMGGPAVRHFRMSPAADYDGFDWDSAGAGRRSVYRFVYRTLDDPFMSGLDFPDPSHLAPTRPFSVSALQSLALLNEKFVLHHSERLAQHLEKFAPTLQERVSGAFRLLFQREPTEEERVDFTAYAAQRGLPAMCLVLFNSNEFLFID